MTKLLEKLIHRVSVLPVKEQDAIAQFLSAELDADNEWDKAFASSPNELELLAQEALKEHCLGKTKKLSLSHDF